MPCIALHWLSRVILSYPKWLPSGIQPQVTGLNRGEVWWVNLDPTQGSEIQKTRPAVILTVNALNRARRTVVVVPLSGSATPRPRLLSVSLLPGLALSRFATKSGRLTSPGLPNVLAKYPNPT